MDILQANLKRIGAERLEGNDRVVKISLVGVGMRSHAGVASTLFRALAEDGIDIRMVATSEIKVSVVVDEKNLEAGVRALHAAFRLHEAPQAGTPAKTRQRRAKAARRVEYRLEKLQNTHAPPTSDGMFL